MGTEIHERGEKDKKKKKKNAERKNFRQTESENDEILRFYPQ